MPKSIKQNISQNTMIQDISTGPIQWTPKPEYLIALATSLGVRW